MKKKLIIVVLSLTMVFSFSSFTSAYEGDVVYQNEEYNYSITLPNNWEQTNQDYIDEEYGFYSYSAIGFNLNGSSPGDPPFLLIKHEESDSFGSFIIMGALEEYEIDPVATKNEFIDIIEVSAEIVGMDIHSYDIEFDTENKKIIQDMAYTLDGKNYQEIIYNIVLNDMVITLDFLLNSKDSNSYLPVVESIANSFKYEREENKVNFITTCGGLYLDYNPVNPTFVFKPTDEIYSYVEFDQAVDDVTDNWYYIENGERTLVHSYNNEDLGLNGLFFKLGEEGPFKEGQWEFEVVTGDTRQSIPFIVTSEESPQPINIYIDGIQQVYDAYPEIIDGTTLVPVRGIFETLGAEIKWDGETQSITAIKDDTTINLKINDVNAYVNGEQITLVQKPQIIKERTMIPLRFVSEAFGADVKWDEITRSIYIITK